MEIVSTNSVFNLLYTHRYIFAFLGAVFEGTFIMILAGVLYKFGYFKFWALTTVLISGYFINGLIFYLIGKYGGNKILEKWGKRAHLTKNLIEKLEEYFKNHSAKTLFITRITYGFSMWAFIIAGSFKMKFKKFFIVSIIAAIVWVTILLGLGYIFGVSYRALGVITKTITVGLGIVFFAFIIAVSILIVYWLRKFTQTRFIEKLAQNNQSSLLRWLGKKITKFAKN